MGEWQESLERKEHKVITKKTEFVVRTGQVRLEASDFITKDRLKQVQTFKCIQAELSVRTVAANKKFGHRVGAGWGKWRIMSGIVCDKRMSIMLKAAV